MLQVKEDLTKGRKRYSIPCLISVSYFSFHPPIGVLPLICLPLYAALPPSKQMLIFEEPPIIGKKRLMIFRFTNS